MKIIRKLTDFIDWVSITVECIENEINDAWPEPQHLTISRWLLIMALRPIYRLIAVFDLATLERIDE